MIYDSKILHTFDIQECKNCYESGKANEYSNKNSNRDELIISNHIPLNFYIGSKKILFLILHWYYKNIKETDPFSYLPTTYHIPSGDLNSSEYSLFCKNESMSPKTIWIVKPGENTNRGKGIQVVPFNQVSKLLSQKELHQNGEEKTFIVQKYLRPFLYNGRKFDIRHFLLITSVNGNMKAYWYK